MTRSPAGSPYSRAGPCGNSCQAVLGPQSASVLFQHQPVPTEKWPERVAGLPRASSLGPGQLPSSPQLARGCAEDDGFSVVHSYHPVGTWA